MDKQHVWDTAYDFVSQHPSFSALSDRQRRKLLAHMQIHHLRPAEILLAPGQNSSHCWLLFSGELFHLPQSDVPPGEEPLYAVAHCQNQGGGEYFHPGDFIGVEQLVEQKTWDAYVIAYEEEALLLAFPVATLKILFQKSPAILRRLRPVLDSHGALFAGLPPALWHYLHRQRHRSNLSYGTTSFHSHRSWQPSFFMLAFFFIVLWLIPSAWLFRIRYPLLALSVLLIGVILKFRYSCEVIVSEHSLIVSTSRLLSLNYRATAYPLALLHDLKIKNFLLCPLLPSLGSFEFEFSGEKKKISWIASPHRLYNTVEALQQQQRERNYPNPEIVPPSTETASRPGPTYLHKSRRLLALHVIFLAAASLLLKFTGLSAPWLWASYLSLAAGLLVWGIGWNRFYWHISPKGLFCYDSFDKRSQPWKLIAFQEIEAIQVCQSWPGKILGCGTIVIHCSERTEHIAHISHPYQLLERCAILRYAQEHDPANLEQTR